MSDYTPFPRLQHPPSPVSGASVYAGQRGANRSHYCWSSLFRLGSKPGYKEEKDGRKSWLELLEYVTEARLLALFLGGFFGGFSEPECPQPCPDP